MPRQRRKRLQGKFAKQAERSRFLRLLLSSVWFQLAVLFCCLIVVGVGIALLPLFQSSPDGVTPVLRVSGLDLIQASRFQKNAEEAFAKGEYERANYLWKAALWRSPGDLEITRGALENSFAADTQNWEWLGDSLVYARRYLHLAQTNEVSVERVSQFCDKRNLISLILELLEPRRGQLPASQQGILYKAFFKLRRPSEMRKLWTEMSDEARSDAEIRLYHDAFIAGWGKIDQKSLEALERLQQASASGNDQLLASQLLLDVYKQGRKVDAYGEVLERLRNEGQAAHFHHAAYWVLLFEANRPNVARHQAEDYWLNLIRKPMTSAIEFATVAKAYNQIGLPGRALDLFKSFEGEFSRFTEYWAAYGSVLVNQEKWEELRILALKTRNDDFNSRVIRAYSYYLEGLADAGQGWTYNAGRAFDSVLEAEANLTIEQAIEMAWQVYNIGYPEISSRLIENYRADLESNLKYWVITFAGAYKLKRADLILDAAKRMMDLDPSNVLSINNFAAALLVRRDKPEEAIGYTLQLYNRDPSVPGFVLNHALALLQNGRQQEAERLFRSLNPNQMRTELLTSLGLGWFELYFLQGNREKAERALLDINETHLFPEQKDWLEQAKRMLGIGQLESVPAVPGD
ncbi:MAG: hypothetical protein M2R45_04240 [Verrucomicrobia subdivision 3 bacterium]|nr:hypothetical protein [Limisphaerales bacterium]MCS1412635.1 hypothetical protein [Limisphaerales bacterium]